MQAPPAYSAIKIDGERAYDLARGGETVVIEPRPVFIESLSLVDMPDPATSVFEARCGKGTYVRALARDMGRIMGCYGHVIALRRTEVGPFDEARAVTMAALLAAAESGDPDQIARLLLPVESALVDLPELLRLADRCCNTRARPDRSDPRPRCPDPDGARLCHLKGSSHRPRRACEGRIASDEGFQPRLTRHTNSCLRH